MAITSVSPYITLPGQAVGALDLYQRLLDAAAVDVARSGDTPGATGEAPDRILHARLRMGASSLMLSDDSSPQGASAAAIHLALDCDDLGEMTERFTGLAAGGTITLPLQDTFWGATFGMLVDRFGVRWMFNCQKPSR